MLLSVSTEGEVLNVEYFTAGLDISGVAFDEELNLLWVLSDTEKQFSILFEFYFTVSLKDLY